MSLNPTVISQSTELEEDRSLFKILILALFGAALSFGTVYFFNKFLLITDFRDLLWSVFTGGAFIIFTILQVCFIKSLIKLNLIVFFETLAAIAIFYTRLYPHPPLPLVLGAILFLFFLGLGVNHGLKLLENSVRVKFILTAKMIIPKVVTALLILLTAVLYLNYFILGKFTDSKGELLTAKLMLTAKPAFKFLTPDFSPDKKVSDLFLSLAENQLNKMKIKRVNGILDGFQVNFDQLSPEAQKEIIATVAAQLKSTAEKVVGPLDPNDSISHAVFKAAKTYFGNLPENFKPIFGIIIAFSFFSIMKGFAILFYWLIEIIAFLIYKILLVSGFAYVTMESRTREFILLK